MTRAMTSLELASMRGASQYSKLYLAIHNPQPVFQATLKEIPTNPSTDNPNDGIVSLWTENTTIGAYTDVKAHMTILVGTEDTAAGRHNKGILRTRLDMYNEFLWVGETSEINFEVGDLLTVVDEFSPFQRHLYIETLGDNNYVYMDYALEYFDEHENFNPMPLSGSHAVVWLQEGLGEAEFLGSNSWCINGNALDHLWVLNGGVGIDFSLGYTDTDADIRVTVDTAGTYRIDHTVTDSVTGKASTTYRYLFVYDEDHPPYKDFTLTSCDFSSDAGGWQFEVKTYGDIGQAVLRDQALVILFSRDWYQGVEGSFGPVNTRENILGLGWIDGETLTLDSESSEVNFVVRGPHHWLGKMSGYPVGVEDTQLPQDGVSPSWTAINDLTVNKGLFHFFYWRSTLWTCADIYPVVDNRQVGSMEAPLGTLWQQILTMSYETILAKPIADRYGSVYIETDSQFLPMAARAGLPVVQALTRADWREKLMLNRRTVDECGYLEASGVIYQNGVGTPVCTRSYGTSIAHYGKVERRERLALESTDQAVELTGMIMGQLNNEFPDITVRLASNHRYFDGAPRQYATLSLAETDTIRGVVLEDERLIPRRISYTFEEGALLTDVVFEKETREVNALLVTCPEMPELPSIPPLPEIPPWPDVPPDGTWEYLVIAYDRHGGDFGAGIYATDNFFDANPRWKNISSGIAPLDLLNIQKISAYLEPDGSSLTLYALSKYDDIDTDRVINRIYRLKNLFAGDRWVAVNTLISADSTTLGTLDGYASISVGVGNTLFVLDYQHDPPIDIDACANLPSAYPQRARYGKLDIGQVGAINLNRQLTSAQFDCVGTLFQNRGHGTYLLPLEINDKRHGEVLTSSDGTMYLLVYYEDYVYYAPQPAPLPGDPPMGGWVQVWRKEPTGAYFSYLTEIEVTGYLNVYSVFKASPWHISGVARGDMVSFALQDASALSYANIYTSNNRGETWGAGGTIHSTSANGVEANLQSLALNDDLSMMSLDDADPLIGITLAKSIHHVPGLSNAFIVGGTGVGGFTRNCIMYTSDNGSTWVSKFGVGLPLAQTDLRYLLAIQHPV